jgi:two-component sensor histidine kinase
MSRSVNLQATLSRLRHNPILGQLFAVTAFAVAFAVRQVTDPVLPLGYPFVTFVPAVILTTFVAGLGPGVVAAVLGGLAAWYFFTPPFKSFGAESGTELALAFYVVIVVINIAIIHIMITTLERLDAERRHSAELTRRAQVMFAEMQHRVSNNLQLISSLLMVHYAKVTDPGALKALEEARTRVATLGRLHRMLHDPSEQNLDVAAYLRDLCRDVMAAAGAAHVTWDVAAEKVDISHDKLVPLALIVAELLSNSLEHGFADGRRGKVSVRLDRDGEDVRVVVRDDGTGLPDGFAVESQTSLGMRIIRALSSQMEGRFSMQGEGGTVAILTFPHQ